MTRARLLSALLAPAALVSLSGCGINSIPTAEEEAKARWADVQNQADALEEAADNAVGATADALENQADALQNQADAVEDAGEAKADAIEANSN